MSSGDQKTEFVRIIELPPVTMVRSGSGDLDAFDKWWGAIAAQDKATLSPKDFMWFNPQLDSMEWLYLLPEGLEDTGGYEVFDFPGGLYAVAACKDAGPDINGANRLIHEWVAQSEIFEESSEANDPHTRYDMGHVITPVNAKETMGYHQMDLFVPIVYKRRPK
ncbi:MAG: transcriptional regulator [Spirochaetales bacterium]|nr:transcriptional regulator [Spirochaetales bacterium]